MEAARAAPWWLIAAAIILPCINWLQMSAVFWLLTQRRAPGRVAFGEMTALIGSAWLLNYIPMRPGLFGRIALHRSLHGIPIRDSAMVLAENIACGAAAIGLALAGVIAIRWTQPAWHGAIACGMLLIPPLLACVVMRGPWRIWSLVALVRAIDLLAWSGRYVIAAAVTGQSLSLVEALALAVVGQVAMLVPLAGNGLGLREWAIGIAAASLPAAWSLQQHGMTSEAGLLMDLFNRSAELAAAVPVGIVCGVLVARRASRGGTGNP